MDITICSGTYSTLIRFCAEHNYNYNYRTMGTWKAEYLASLAFSAVAKLQMPSVHPFKSAKVLDYYLVQSKAVTL